MQISRRTKKISKHKFWATNLLPENTDVKFKFETKPKEFDVDEHHLSARSHLQRNKSFVCVFIFRKGFCFDGKMNEQRVCVVVDTFFLVFCFCLQKVHNMWQLLCWCCCITSSDHLRCIFVIKLMLQSLWHFVLCVSNHFPNHGKLMRFKFPLAC